MRGRLSLAFSLAGLAVAVGACTTVLGSFEVATVGADASTPADATSGIDAAVEDSAAPDTGPDDAGPDVLVDAGADVVPPALPCTVGDAGTLVYPGDPCNFDSNGTPVPALGACKPGKWACVDLGGGQRTAQCFGTVGPKTEVCTPLGQTPADENCDGTVDEGCPCTTGATRPCGVGACAGTQTCSAGAWAACNGPAPGPRNCASAADNDCNGTPDKSEDFCSCVGTANQKIPLGGTVLCGNFGSLNKCADVKRTCTAVPDGTRVQWDIACESGVPDCINGRDNDCQGGPDSAERQCNVCRTPQGSRTTPKETFCATLIGCAGAISSSNAAALCAPGCSVANRSDWTAPRGVTIPAHHYWIAEDNLKLYKVSIGTGCKVETSQPQLYTPACTVPTRARVCAPALNSNRDSSENVCNPTCPAADYLGGCSNQGTTNTAGTLCRCP